MPKQRRCFSSGLAHNHMRHLMGTSISIPGVGACLAGSRHWVRSGKQSLSAHGSLQVLISPPHKQTTAACLWTKAMESHFRPTVFQAFAEGLSSCLARAEGPASTTLIVSKCVTAIVMKNANMTCFFFNPMRYVRHVRSVGCNPRASDFGLAVVSSAITLDVTESACPALPAMTFCLSFWVAGTRASTQNFQDSSKRRTTHSLNYGKPN